MQNYYFIEIKNPLQIEDWSEIEGIAISEYQSTGIEDFSLEESEVDEILGERSYSGADIPVSVIQEVEDKVESDDIKTKKIYFADKASAEKFLIFLKSNQSIDSILREESVQDWNEEWKKSYKPIPILNKMEIVPSWQKETYLSEIENKLYIYPGMGFGTGNHETTYLCLELLLKTDTYKKAKNCMDFGCGSGILGLALRLFSIDVELDLYDIDQEALDNCIQNIELNEIDLKGIRLLLPESRNKFRKKYDVVFANILKNVLELEADEITSLVEDKGVLILSGLLNGQEEDIIKLYLKKNPGLFLVEIAKKGDWVAILLEKR